MQMLVVRGLLASTLFLMGLLFFTGCNVFNRRAHQRSNSIAEFLYSDKEGHIEEPRFPVLRLPLKVGVAFAPSEGFGRSAGTSVQQQQLLARVAETFRSQGFVASIEPIPHGYLRSKGGFVNLEQVGRMLGVEVMVLLSYDQVQFTDENLLSLTYWTIVGAYIFNGNKNDTQTLVEAAVYHIPSRALLFRAPGVDRTRSKTTGYRTDEQRREDAEHSLSLATDQVIRSLATELEAFKAKVKEGKAPVVVEHRPGYRGGGAMDALTLLLLGLLFLAARVRKQTSD